MDSSPSPSQSEKTGLESESESLLESHVQHCNLRINIPKSRSVNKFFEFSTIKLLLITCQITFTIKYFKRRANILKNGGHFFVVANLRIKIPKSCSVKKKKSKSAAWHYFKTLVKSLLSRLLFLKSVPDYYSKYVLLLTLNLCYQVLTPCHIRSSINGPKLHF